MANKYIQLQFQKTQIIHLIMERIVGIHFILREIRIANDILQYIYIYTYKIYIYIYILVVDGSNINRYEVNMYQYIFDSRYKFINMLWIIS